MLNCKIVIGVLYSLSLSLGLVGLYHCFCKIDNNSNRSFLSVFREKNRDHRFLIL